MRGRFITIEGCDGAGKSTQISLLKQHFASVGAPVYFTREPGGTKISESIRTIILEPNNAEMDAVTELMLYAASRRQLIVEVIKPRLEQGITVICDRFTDSTTAYQGFGRGLDLEVIYHLNKWALDGLEIDLTIFLDVPPDKSFNRRFALDKCDRLELEKDDFHRRVYDGYMWLINKAPHRIARIDGTKSANAISKEIINLIKSRGIID